MRKVTVNDFKELPVIRAVYIGESGILKHGKEYFIKLNNDESISLPYKLNKVRLNKRTFSTDCFGVDKK